MDEPNIFNSFTYWEREITREWQPGKQIEVANAETMPEIFQNALADTMAVPEPVTDDVRQTITKLLIERLKQHPQLTGNISNMENFRILLGEAPAKPVEPVKEIAGTRRSFVTNLALILAGSAITGKLLASTDFLSNEGDKQKIVDINKTFSGIENPNVRELLSSRLTEIYDQVHVCKKHHIGLDEYSFKAAVKAEFRDAPGVTEDLVSSLINSVLDLAKSDTKTAYGLKESIQKAKAQYYTEKGFDPNDRGATFSQPIQQFLQAQIAKASAPERP